MNDVTQIPPAKPRHPRALPEQSEWTFELIEQAARIGAGLHRHGYAAMPAAGQPFMVSNTCVLNPMLFAPLHRPL